MVTHRLHSQHSQKCEIDGTKNKTTSVVFFVAHKTLVPDTNLSWIMRWMLKWSNLCLTGTIALGVKGFPNGGAIMDKVFVYGTLMKGHGNYRSYLSQSEFLGTGKITGYALYAVSSYPGIVPEAGDIRA